MKILYLANLIPYPLDGGGKIFTYSTIDALSKTNDVDLLCFFEHENVEQGIKSLSSICNQIKVLPIRVTTSENKHLMVKKAFKSIFSKRPLAVDKYSSSDMFDLIETMLENSDYDCVFFNLLAMTVYYDFIKKRKPNIRVILYEQNCESLIYQRLYKVEKNIIKKCFIYLEYKKLDRFEQKVVNCVDKLIVLSEEDKNNLRIEDASVIPIGVQPQTFKKKYDQNSHEKVRMLFVGTMTWAPNSEGIIWFLKNVMPKLNDPSKYELTIVGKNPSQYIIDLSDNFQNVQVLGYVDNLNDLYETSDVLVVPLFVGSGQRVKIIEAFARGFAVISTTIGAEGLMYTNNENILIADSPEDFYLAINKCNEHAFLDFIGANGKYLFDSKYSTEVIAKNINAAIQ